MTSPEVKPLSTGLGALITRTLKEVATLRERADDMENECKEAIREFCGANDIPLSYMFDARRRAMVGPEQLADDA